MIAALTTRAIGFVGQRLSMFMSCSLSDILALSFCSSCLSPSFLFLLRPVSVQVIGAWVDVDLYVQVDLEGIWFHEFCWVGPVLLISCLADALGVLGLRPGSGIL